MDIRILQYFVAVADEGSITNAAKALNVTQPTLSRQLQDLEDELGKKLFTRSNKNITLTFEGKFLYGQAQKIIGIFKNTQSEIKNLPEQQIQGDVYIGAAEVEQIRLVAKAVAKCSRRHPAIKFHFLSDRSDEVCSGLQDGFLDFGIILNPIHLERYHSLKLSSTNTWGLLMRKDSPLAKREVILLEDLLRIPLILSNQKTSRDTFFNWVGNKVESLYIVGSYNLPYNASLLVDEGVGYAFFLDGAAKVFSTGSLCFRPLEPKTLTDLTVIWRKEKSLSAAAQEFLEILKETLMDELSTSV